ncbi:chromosome segregation protein SMC [Nocardioides sp. cx-169]|uniref:SAV_6107 family HEPN domain-containing protein n=1 Tax=Nocardioides sp. cx-169 TaxID=2899080 RepID=UPI001E50F82C|nr:SAV_6107 family HEPN domain-containing protein [Nocardioides sp. cx-169]MCD4534746.1 chromosome segregation protein SMC [Nocardioides sp. cx-169]
MSLNPYALPATTHSYLARAAESLSEAVAATDVPTRYATAHVAALRAAAALLAARARPAPARRRPQKNAWVLLAEVAPELGEWATFFAAGAAKRAAAEAGSTRAVTERDADDLVRDADRFLGVVEQSLGLVPHAPLGQTLAQARVIHRGGLDGPASEVPTLNPFERMFEHPVRGRAG